MADTEMTVTADAKPRPGPMETLAGIATAVAGLSLLGLVIVQAWQVFARYVMNDSPSWTEPVTLLLLSTAMSLGAAAGVHAHRHFGFYLLADALPMRWKRMLHAFAALVIALIGTVIAMWAARLLVDGIDIRMAGAPLPQSLPYLPLAVGGALMTVFALAQLYESLRAVASPTAGVR
jgi:TRAP-type C4-dicarboxylate transport system permease small subunit